MKALELKIPPVVLFILFAVAMYALASVDNGWVYMHIPLKIIWVAILFVFSGYVGVSGVIEFKKAKTTVDPTKPNKASTVVNSGIFSKTRNPMYVALFTLLLCWGFWLENGLSLMLSIFFIPYMTRFQIKPEERALERIFGDDYLTYKAKVRRWI
ncbi:hypothetical protein VTH8203_02259 [Vibrio thalassae]|uniref:Isoprenylcysteine carboxyl methyltransferase (ICMT) family protein n=1 Tax=Vibrio thalassae TaxID=1243014 RepID=A0A240EIX3_9VIBR|nr:isoprenylcysteine carboxylmethyltransferase family protein [Vibrio thalassae]SNX48638.1 hypothetical protein VTH8203_02259 [Vibrio thalassae]